MKSPYVAALERIITTALLVTAALAALASESQPTQITLSSHRESWMRQTHVLVRGADGAWRIALGQGVVMYEGPPLDPALHQRYVGTYVISPGRKLVLAWEDGALQATFPTGGKTQIFLASPTEEASRTEGAGKLKFTLAEDGRPVEASLVRGAQEAWRAKRE